MIIHSLQHAVKALLTAVFALAILVSANLAGAGTMEPSQLAEAIDNTVRASSSDDCNGSTSEEYECISVRCVIIRDELEKTYRALRSKLANDAKSTDKFTRQTAIEVERRLERSQKAWVHFLDSDCRLESAELIGSNREELSLYSCQVERTQERIKMLKELAI